MASSSGDEYIIGRDKTESERLKVQHDLSVRNSGYVAHPRIMARLPTRARIADIATGSAAWALEMAHLLPEAQIVGFDISPEQFPPSKPSNIIFTLQDAKQPFPEAEYGTFDFAHVRALVGAMQPYDWEVVMRNVIQLLKPGGYLQWGEGDISRLNCIRSNLDFYRYTGLPKLLYKWNGAVGPRMAEGFRNLGEAAYLQLEDVEEDFYSSDRDPETRDAMTRQLVIGLLGFAEKAGIWPPEELEKIRKEIAMDIDNGAYIRVDLRHIVGQKPQ